MVVGYDRFYNYQFYALKGFQRIGHLGHIGIEGRALGGEARVEVLKS